MSRRAAASMLVLLAAGAPAGCLGGDDPPDGRENAAARPQPAAARVDRAALQGLGKLAFVATVDGRTDVYVLGERGEPRNLTDDEAAEGEPAWSPDGGRIAYGSARDGNYDLIVADADGGRRRRLTDLPANEGTPSWSPDGSRIVFGVETEDEEHFGIYVIAANGGRARRLIAGEGCTVESPAWSPDGDRIAFASNCIDRRGRSVTGGAQRATGIYLMDRRGGHITRVVKPQEAFHPAWSPDGRRIAFASNDRAGLYAVRADGSGLRRLTPAAQTTPVADWAAEGERLVFVDYYGSEVSVVAASGGKPHELTSGFQASEGISAHGGSSVEQRPTHALPEA